MQRLFNLLLPVLMAGTTVPTLATAAALTPHFGSGPHIFKNNIAARAACSEGTARLCYGIGNPGTPQKLNADDIAYAASYLRFIGQDNAGTADAFWNMPAEPTTSCSEWGLPVDGAGTVLALAKHSEPNLNSSVLYEDLANTIDGGEDGSKASSALIGCASNGGQMGVVFDAKNAAYNTDEYKKSRKTPRGLVIKLVRAPGS
ncbi:hypothetical protein V8F33_006506 [Rhypophila sp. PSN 637]